MMRPAPPGWRRGAPDRRGAGRVARRDAPPIHAAQLTAIAILPMDGSVDLVDIPADERRNAVFSVRPSGRRHDQALVEAALGMKPAVLDADALTSFAGAPERLFELVKGRTVPTVLTPHDGEFARLFPDLAETPSKLDRVREAAARAGAIVVAKGPDTVVASPDGRAAIADNAPPDLATAGSGDVLAGMIAGLLAQGMPAFDGSRCVDAHAAARGKAGPDRGGPPGGVAGGARRHRLRRDLTTRDARTLFLIAGFKMT
jgi:NAD(P)H-hydrate repair Nnr-like enzyme with NAD(P)H-hydrate dehydratase domain